MNVEPALVWRPSRGNKAALRAAKMAIACARYQLAGTLFPPEAKGGFHNFRHSLATFLVSRGKDVKTIGNRLSTPKYV
jgi:integrase